MIQSHLNTENLRHKRVFLRGDLNVPITNGYIKDDFRLKALQPTLDLLREKNAFIILGTHLGRPQGKYVEDLSTKPLAAWLDNKGYTVKFAKDLEQAHTLIKDLCPGSIIMLENLRFYEGEKSYSKEFAEKLYDLAPDYYVNDAFGLLHRNDTSVALLPKLYPDNNRTIGLLIEREIKALSRIKYSPDKPFVIVAGGAKVEDKLPLLEHVIDKASSILLCPPLVFTFLKAQGKEVGKSLVFAEYVDKAKEILRKAKDHNVKVFFPIDYLVAQDRLEGPLSYKEADNLDSNDVGISIGHKTVDEYKKELIIRSNANTVLYVGAMGFLSRPETLQEFRSLLQTIAQSDAYSVIGGGDSVAAVNKFNLAPNFQFLSAGGGAMLTYLSNQDLPALIALF